MSIEINYLNIATEIAFNYLRNTNKLLIINDKKDGFFHTFYNKYKVCDILLVGNEFDSIPRINNVSVTNLGKNLRTVYDDHSLNSPVDVIYIDITSTYLYEEYLKDSISDNTVMIFKMKYPTEALLPLSYKSKFQYSYKFGDWENEPNINSEYYLLLL